MLTEEIPTEKKDRQAQKLSRALCDLAPLSTEIVNKRGKPVSVGTAGYVLRAGEKYHLRVRCPVDDEEIQGIHINNKPEFIDVSPEMTQLDQKGRKIRCIPFRVRADLVTALKRLGMYVRYDDVDIAFQYSKDADHISQEYSCPVVVMPRFAVLVLTLFTSVMGLLVPALFNEFYGEIRRGETNVLDRALSYFSQPWTYLGLLLGLLLLVLIYWVNFLQLNWRSRQLRQEFRDRYPNSVATATSEE